MIDRKKLIEQLETDAIATNTGYVEVPLFQFSDILALLKEQGKKQIALHKKHIITWRRNDEFNMRKLYEAICETLLDEGELFIARTDDHEKVDFVFYVAEGR